MPATSAIGGPVPCLNHCGGVAFQQSSKEQNDLVGSPCIREFYLPLKEEMTIKKPL